MPRRIYRGGRVPDVVRFRPLTEAERELAADDKVLRAARAIAGGYASRMGLDRDAFESEAMAEVVRAARRYRPGPKPWGAYAVESVRRAMIDARRDASRRGMSEVPGSMRGVTLSVRSIDDDTFPAAV